MVYKVNGRSSFLIILRRYLPSRRISSPGLLLPSLGDAGLMHSNSLDAVAVCIAISEETLLSALHAIIILTSSKNF